jgi:hypothetical protein
MDDPQNIPEITPPEKSAAPGSEPAGAEPAPAKADYPILSAQTLSPQTLAALDGTAPADPAEQMQAEASIREAAASWRRTFRHNLLLLLSLALAAFVLTAWILVRVDAPFGIFSSGPQEIVRAHLRALDRGELRPAYDMLSPRYRGQVSFDTWHELFITHWRMFHADVVRTETTSIGGPGVTLEIFLHGADDRDYRARFTLVRTDGRWWIDDVHWTQEPDERDFSRT